jgi:3-polyprenyl-4-hydroxybenzoate decarboxylase
MADEKQRVMAGVSGATGIVYAARALEILRLLNRWFVSIKII